MTVTAAMSGTGNATVRTVKERFVKGSVLDGSSRRSAIAVSVKIKIACPSAWPTVKTSQIAPTARTRRTFYKT